MFLFWLWVEHLLVLILFLLLQNDIVEFLRLQVQAHHPGGAKTSDTGAFAVDWDVWMVLWILLLGYVLLSCLRNIKKKPCCLVSRPTLDTHGHTLWVWKHARTHTYTQHTHMHSYTHICMHTGSLYLSLSLSSWYDLCSWLGVKNQLSILSISVFLSHKHMHARHMHMGALTHSLAYSLSHFCYLLMLS